MTDATLRLVLLGQDRSASRALNDVGESADKNSGRMSKFGQIAAAGLAAAGVAAVGFAVSSVKAASDAQQSLGGTQAIFGKFAEGVVQTSNNAAKQFGLSANEYRENANLIGSLLKNQGVAMKDLAGQTQNLVGTGADLAATYGGPTKDAVNALASAFKGEFDPLQQYGITLKQSTINTEALRVANVKSTTEFNKLSSAQQQAALRQATQNLITKQSTDAQGQFAKQTNTLAEQQQILGAQFDNIRAKVGTFLLPILTKLFSYLNDTAIPAIQGMVADWKNSEGAMGEVRAVFEKVFAVLSDVFGFIIDNKEAVATFAGVILTVVAAVKIWTAVQTALNVVLAANPIGLVVVALAALAAGLVYAYKHSETFRNIVNAAFRGIAAVGKWMWENVLKPNFAAFVLAIKTLGSWGRWLWNSVFQPVFKFIVSGIATLLRMWADMLHALAHVPGFGWAGDLANKLDAAAGKASALANNIRDIPDRKTATVVINTIHNVVHTTGGRVPTDPGMGAGAGGGAAAGRRAARIMSGSGGGAAAAGRGVSVSSGSDSDYVVVSLDGQVLLRAVRRDLRVRGQVPAI